MKIRTKIMLLFAILTVSIISVMSFFVYYLASQYSFEDFYKRLEIRAYLTATATFPPVGTDTLAYNYIRDRHLEKLPAEKEHILRILPDNKVESHPEIDLKPEFYKTVIREGRETYRKGDRFYEGILYTNGDNSYIVIVSAVNDYMSQYMTDLRRILLTCLTLALAVIIGTGLFFSRYILMPVHRIMDQVKNISSSNLHLRVEAHAGKDEIRELADTFNNMLDRLEMAFETQNNFVSNASHELSTPLTAIIGEAELALSKDRDCLSYRTAVSNMLREAERLEHITRSLLHLAQTGFDGKKESWGIVRTDELLFAVKHVIDRITPDNKVEIDYSLFPEEEEKMNIQGSFQLLELALSNIVSNAVKYSSNRPVSLALAATNSKNIIIVRDQGIGIPLPDMPYIFSPFFRASNTQPFKGYGIGLPLTKNIIRMHKGEIIVNSRMNEGTEIRVELPSA